MLCVQVISCGPSIEILFYKDNSGTEKEKLHGLFFSKLSPDYHLLYRFMSLF